MKTAIWRCASALALAGGLSASALAQEPSEAAAERLAEYHQTGETTSCLQRTRVRHIRPLDDQHFLIEMRGGQHYLSTMSNRCSNAARNHTYLEYRSPGSQLCRNEIVTVKDQSTRMMTGSCSFGAFERLEPVSDADAGA